MFATIHPKFRTPWLGTILLGAVIAVAAAFLPISLLGQLVSFGTALAFSIVCLSVIYLRIKHPELERPFRVPGGIITAVLGIAACLFLAWQNFSPMIEQAFPTPEQLANGVVPDPLTLQLLGGYAVIGAVVYALYGFWHSKLAKGIDITDDPKLSTPDQALGGNVDNVKED